MAVSGENSPIILTDDNNSSLDRPSSPVVNSAAEALRALNINSDSLTPGNDRADTLQPLHRPTATRPHREASRSVTEPSPSSPSMLGQPVSPQPSPRNRSPYSRSHRRSRSTSNTSSSPSMLRANSLPTHSGMSQTYLISPAGSRPQSPYRSGAPRARSPLRNSLDESGGVIGGAAAGIPESIHEDAELELTPKQHTEILQPLAAYQPSSGPLTFPRRRRPSSPLHQVLSASDVTAERSPVSNSSNETLLASQSPTPSPHAKDPSRFNEAFPQVFAPYASSVSSSVPSTPSSIRSRSPSISSLETIPDSPDAEMAAIEEDEILLQRRARPRQRNNSDSSNASSGGEAMRRSSLDTPERGRTSIITGGRKGDQKKRWSVCGHERWGDRDLETIWED